MPDILGITGPIFLLIGLGYAAIHWQLLTKAGLPALARLVINFCLPALLFRSLSQRSWAEVANGGYLLAYTLGSLITLGAGLAWARKVGQSRQAAARTGMGMACSNSAFVGFPVALQVLGPDAALALALTMLVENFVKIPVCLALADSAGQHRQPWPRAMAGALWGLRKNPIVLGIAAGLAANLLQWHLPGPVQRAVVYIGGNLAGLQVGSMVRQVTAVALGKLLLHPAAVALALLGIKHSVGPVVLHL